VHSLVIERQITLSLKINLLNYILYNIYVLLEIDFFTFSFFWKIFELCIFFLAIFVYFAQYKLLDIDLGTVYL